MGKWEIQSGGRMGDSGGRMGDSVEGGLGEEIVMGGSVVGRMGDTVLWIF